MKLFSLTLLSIGLSYSAFADGPATTISKYVFRPGDSAPTQTVGSSEDALPISDHYEIQSKVEFEELFDEDPTPVERGHEILEPMYPLNDEEVRPATDEILGEFLEGSHDYYDRYPCSGNCTATLSVEVRNFEED